MFLQLKARRKEAQRLAAMRFHKKTLPAISQRTVMEQMRKIKFEGYLDISTSDERLGRGRESEEKSEQEEEEEEEEEEEGEEEEEEEEEKEGESDKDSKTKLTSAEIKKSAKPHKKSAYFKYKEQIKKRKFLWREEFPQPTDFKKLVAVRRMMANISRDWRMRGQSPKKTRSVTYLPKYVLSESDLASSSSSSTTETLVRTSISLTTSPVSMTDKKQERETTKKKSKKQKDRKAGAGGKAQGVSKAWANIKLRERKSEQDLSVQEDEAYFQEVFDTVDTREMEISDAEEEESASPKIQDSPWFSQPKSIFAPKLKIISQIEPIVLDKKLIQAESAGAYRETEIKDQEQGQKATSDDDLYPRHILQSEEHSEETTESSKSSSSSLSEASDEIAKKPRKLTRRQLRAKNEMKMMRQSYLKSAGTAQATASRDSTQKEPAALEKQKRGKIGGSRRKVHADLEHDAEKELLSSKVSPGAVKDGLPSEASLGAVRDGLPTAASLGAEVGGSARSIKAERKESLR